MTQQRFRRLTDLFVTGRAIDLPDGGHLWVQVINSYMRDECVNDAQIARSRLVLALKDSGGERNKIEARFIEHGRKAMEADVASAKVDEKYSEIVYELEQDPDWVEKIAILRRTDFTQSAKPGENVEREYVEKILVDWSAAIAEKLDTERKWQDNHYATVSDHDLIEDYLELWLDKRGGELASAEYALTEMWYATRYCDAVDGPDGLDHSVCNGHPTPVFPSKGDARSAPDGLQELITKALAELAMEGRDPKGLASPESSSGSSPTPNAAEASTPSTSIETHELPPGT